MEIKLHFLVVLVQLLLGEAHRAAEISGIKVWDQKSTFALADYEAGLLCLLFKLNPMLRQVFQLANEKVTRVVHT